MVREVSLAGQTPSSAPDPLVRLSHSALGKVHVCHPKFMRDPETIETELMSISALADDSLKFERIVAWCASHPDEVPFALHQMMSRRGKDKSGTA
jgi:hypothetical protein